MVTMNLIVYVTSTVVVMLLLSDHSTASTTTPVWVPSSHPPYSNSSHVASEEASKETANEINDMLEDMVDAKGICPCRDVSCTYTGFPMAVVVLATIPEYQNMSDEDKEEHVHDLAQRLLNHWDFNTCNDGAVTIVVADERIVVTVIDQASEYLVPDDCQKFVENKTSIFFEDGRIKEGLVQLIQQYRLIVEKNHSCNSDDTDAHLKRSVIIPIILIIAMIIVILIVALVVIIYRRRGSKDIRTTEASVPLKDQQHAEKA